MSLVDRFANAKTPPPANHCPFRRFLDDLDETERAAVLAAIDRGIPTLRIHSEIRAEGHHVSRTSIAHHRQGICCCPKDAA